MSVFATALGVHVRCAIRAQPLGVLVSVALSFGVSPESLTLLANWRQAPELIGDALQDAFDQWGVEAVSYVQANAFGPGEDQVGIRSGALRQNIDETNTGFLQKRLGVTEGTAAPYARPILGPGTTRITPVNAEHLWIPIADNLNPSGLARMSPREAFDRYNPGGGPKRLRIFRSKKGNLVVFGAEPKQLQSGKTSRRFTRGARKGQERGRLLFVLKKEVEIEGTDALARNVEAYGFRLPELADERLLALKPRLEGGGA